MYKLCDLRVIYEDEKQINSNEQLTLQFPRWWIHCYIFINCMMNEY